MGQGFHFTASEAMNSYLVIAIFHMFSRFSVLNIQVNSSIQPTATGCKTQQQTSAEIHT